MKALAEFGFFVEEKSEGSEELLIVRMLEPEIILSKDPNELSQLIEKNINEIKNEELSSQNIVETEGVKRKYQIPQIISILTSLKITTFLHMNQMLMKLNKKRK